MYNARYILTGIILFIIAISWPFLMNVGGPSYTYPEVKLPRGLDMEECVETGDWMRANHMILLIEWRDMAVREAKTVYVNSRGSPWTISLQETCLDCHAEKSEFCDKCHSLNSVDPNCWDCHFAPGEVVYVHN